MPGEGTSLALCIMLLNKVNAETCRIQAIYVAETLDAAFHAYKTLDQLTSYTGIKAQLAPQNKSKYNLYLSSSSNLTTVLLIIRLIQ